MNKCSNLWNKTNKQTLKKASEEYKNIVGQTPCTPCITRWNCFYGSVTELLKIQKLLPNICQKLIPHFSMQDLQFLKEYETCTKPIAFCLNMLQCEKEVFFGDILPWIYGVKHNLEYINQYENKTTVF